MPDVYIAITEAAPTILEGLMTALELRAADPQQRAMLDTYLTDAFVPRARVLEVGCGTGAVTRVLAAWPGVAAAVALIPPRVCGQSPCLGAGQSTLTFEEADGRALPFAVTHLIWSCAIPRSVTCRTRTPYCTKRYASCARVGAWRSLTATTPRARWPRAPETRWRPVPRRFGHFIHDPWLVRRLPRLLQATGVQLQRIRSYGYVERQRQGSCWSVGWTWGRTRW